MDDHDETNAGTGAPQGQQNTLAGVQPVVPPPAKPATAEQLQEAETKIEVRMSGFERSMVRLTTYGLIVTIVTGIIFLGQLYEMISGGTQTDKLVGYAKTQADSASDIAQASEDFTDSAKWMEEHMQDAATAMQDSVDTASQDTKTTINNAQAAFRSEQRAWVGVLGTSDNGGFTETEPWKIKVVFFNSGRTPARNVQISGMYITSPFPISGPLPEHIKKLIFRPGQSIAPQGTYRAAIGSDFLAEASTTISDRQGAQALVSQYKPIKNKELFLYYYGILKYDDNSGKARETQYCIFLAVPDTREAAMCDAFNDLN